MGNTILWPEDHGSQWGIARAKTEDTDLENTFINFRESGMSALMPNKRQIPLECSTGNFPIDLMKTI